MPAPVMREAIDKAALRLTVRTSALLGAGERKMRDLVDEYQSTGEPNVFGDSCGKNMPVNGWLPFGNDPIHGVYWVCGTYPEYDIDVDDYGRTVGFPTGGVCTFVSLVEIDFDPGKDGEFEARPVNEYATGAFEDEYGITHYMPFLRPPPVCA